MASFVEMLVAEATAEGLSWDSHVEKVESGDPRVLVEERMARVTSNWSSLPAVVAAKESLARFEAGAASGDPLDALVALCALQHELELRLGEVLCAMSQHGAWPQMLFTCVGHYSVERLGLSRSTMEDNARLHRRLKRFPLLKQAYVAGEASREAATFSQRRCGSARVANMSPDVFALSAQIEAPRDALQGGMRAGGFAERGKAGGAFGAEAWPEVTSSTEREDREAAAREDPAQRVRATLSHRSTRLSHLHIRQHGCFRRKLENYPVGSRSCRCSRTSRGRMTTRRSARPATLRSSRVPGIAVRRHVAASERGWNHITWSSDHPVAATRRRT